MESARHGLLVGVRASGGQVRGDPCAVLRHGRRKNSVFLFTFAATGACSSHRLWDLAQSGSTQQLLEVVTFQNAKERTHSIENGLALLLFLHIGKHCRGSRCQSGGGAKASQSQACIHPQAWKWLTCRAECAPRRWPCSPRCRRRSCRSPFPSPGHPS